MNVGLRIYSARHGGIFVVKDAFFATMVPQCAPDAVEYDPATQEVHSELFTAPAQCHIVTLTDEQRFGKCAGRI